MLRLYGPGIRPSEPLNRREMLRIGGLGMSGLTLTSLLGSQCLAKSSPTSQLPSFGQARRKDACGTRH